MRHIVVKRKCNIRMQFVTGPMLLMMMMMMMNDDDDDDDYDITAGVSATSRR